MKKRLFVFALLVCLFLPLLSFPLVRAEGLFFGMSTYGVSKSQFMLLEEYPGGYWAEAQRYVGNDEYLVNIQFMVKKIGAPTGSLRGALINATSPYAIIENSTNTVSPTEISTADTWISFDFASTTQLLSSQLYFYAVYVYDNATFDSSNLCYAIGDGSSGLPNCDGTKYSANGVSSWSHGGTQDLCIMVYTTATSGGGSSEEESGDPSVELIISGLVDFLLPLIVLLLPVFLLVFFLRRTDKWLIIIGLAIGAGLGYYFGLVPVWLLFLVVVAVVGLAYSEVKKNG